jgi:hypothetical protein
MRAWCEIGCIRCLRIFILLKMPQKFEDAPSGTVGGFAENPEGWGVQLVKH